MYRSSCVARVYAISFALMISIGLAAVPASADEEITVVGGNSSNSLMFWLKYGVETGDIDAAITLNDDANAYPSLNSFTFLGDACGSQRTDILAASTNASAIVRYTDGIGSGARICGGSGQPPCPPRPVGLSTGPEQVFSVATSGAAGTTPGVFTFTPRENDCSQFERTGGALSATGVNRIRAIADTAFVRSDSDDLEAGELLVLVGNPAMIVRVNAFTNTSARGEIFANSLAVFSNNYRRATPTGLAIVQGENPNVLVTLSTGVVVSFYYDSEATAPGWRSKTLDASSFPNPRGIAAGTRDGVPYIVVSEQNRGRYIRADLQGAGGELALVKPFREIVTPVGAPEGVAIKYDEGFSVSVTQDQCFDVNPGTDLTETGCDILGAIQVHLSSYGEGQNPGDRITASLKLLEDTRNGSPLGSLDLGAAFDKFAGFTIPPYCRGFELADGKRYVVVLDMGLNFAVGAANFIKVTEQAKSLLGVGECTEEGTRIYHRPGDSEGELLDKTFYCSNPSRSILDVFSPVVLCFNPLHVERTGVLAATNNLQTAVETRRDEVNDEIRLRIESLKGIVDELRTIADNAVADLGFDPGFDALAAELNTRITGRTNPNSSWPQIRYKEASCSLDKAAVAVFEAKDPLFRDNSNLTLDKTLYARALSETLGLAFYIMETGALEEYEPPAPLCDPGDDTDNPRPELPDVTCRPWPDTNPCAN